MDMKWLDDLVALAEAGTLTEAAEMRNVTQPAFTRRIQQIELWLGAPVLDRTRRPARVAPGIMRKIEDMRLLASELRQLRRDVRDWDSAQHRVTIAAQHSISSGVLPQFIARLQHSRPNLSIRLRSANREDCYALLMTRQVSMLIVYELAGSVDRHEESLMERLLLGPEELVPVMSSRYASPFAPVEGGLPILRIIGYPPDVFFGTVLDREILPDLATRCQVQVTCETALVPAALALALEGAGVAWLPRASCEAHLKSGQLSELDSSFARTSLNIVAARMTTPRTQHTEMVWNQLAVFMARFWPGRTEGKD